MELSSNHDEYNLMMAFTGQSSLMPVLLLSRRRRRRRRRLHCIGFNQIAQSVEQLVQQQQQQQVLKLK